uniref:C962R-like N-terminal AEP domain-containing protein n=1 Tax=viral metagenome TaxID=1070528 RepID=A0A6C0BPM9_9ZZZZ
MARRTLTPPSSLLLKFIRDNSFHHQSSSRNTWTHGSMDGSLGGVFYVDDEQGFHSKFASDCMNRIPMFITEIKSSPNFRFFVDLDFKFKPPKRCWTDKERSLICSIIGRTVQEFYPAEGKARRFMMMVCDISQWLAEQEEAAKQQALPEIDISELLLGQSEPEKKDKEEQEKEEEEEAVPETKEPAYYKDGNLHITFPHCIVNAQQWIIITQAIRSKLAPLFQRLKKKQVLVNTVTDIVDFSVLTGSLRMVGSHKSGECKLCHKRGCGECSYVGKVDQGRVYNLREMLIPDERTQRFVVDQNYSRKMKQPRNFGAVVQFCSIRADPGTPLLEGFAPYPGCPSISPELVDSLTKKHLDLLTAKITPGRKYARLGKTKQITLLSEEEKATLRRKCTRLDPQGKVAILLRNKLREMHPRYKALTISQLSLNSAKTKYTIFVRGDFSTFCQNLKNPPYTHNSRLIWFQARYRGLVQKCSCKCDTLQNRRSGLCKDFESACSPFTDDQRAKLFPVKYNQSYRVHPLACRTRPIGDAKEKDTARLLGSLRFKAWVQPQLNSQPSDN